MGGSQLKKVFLMLALTLFLFSISACSSAAPPAAVPETPASANKATPIAHSGEISAPLEPSANIFHTPEIAFAFQEKKPLSMTPLQAVKKGAVEKIVFSEQTVNQGMFQGFYRKKDIDEPQNIYSYIEIGGTRYDLGQIAYGEDNILAGESGNFRFSEPDFKLDISGAAVYRQYKTYGAKYDAVAYYTIENGIPIFLCEITGVTGYADYDASGVMSVLSTDRAVPFTEYTVNKFDLSDKTLHFTSLTELLSCDGIYYEEEHGRLFFTFHKPTGSNWVNPEDGCVYSFADGVFLLRYIPANVTQVQ